MLTTQRNSADLQQIQKDQRGIATDVEKLKAVVGRDEAKDGLFVFAVRSTGIYCKPSCSRLGCRAGHEGLQYIPVERTAKTKSPSLASSLPTTAFHFSTSVAMPRWSFCICCRSALFL